MEEIHFRVQGEEIFDTSRWTTEKLYAFRVICPLTTPGEVLPILQAHVPNEMPMNNHLDKLIAGPAGGVEVLRELGEAQILQTYDEPGYGIALVWAALATALKNNHDQVPAEDPDFDRLTRQPFHDVFPGLPAWSCWAEGWTVPMVDPQSVGIADCFTRYVLNCAQAGVDFEESPLVSYRNNRDMHMCQLSTSFVKSYDEGGIKVDNGNGRRAHVALVEAKKAFQEIRDGEPVISDNLLAQLVGEAIAFARSDKNLFKENIITIVAVKNFVRFFHLHVTESYLERIVDAELSENLDDKTSFLRVESQEWIDLSQRNGRQLFVKHILALMNMAHSRLSA